MEHTPDLDRVQRTLPASGAWNPQKVLLGNWADPLPPRPWGSGSAPTYRRQHREAVGTAVVFNLLLDLLVGFTVLVVDG